MSTVDPHRLDCDWLGHRNEVLEEAAKVCEELRPTGGLTDEQAAYYSGLNDAARAIRALKRE